MATTLNRRPWTAACLMALASLAGCSELPDLGRQNSGICSAVPPAREGQPANSYEQAVQRDECLHRVAYALARAPDPADQVVGAVIGACRGPIDRSATLLANGDQAAETFYLQEMERVARERALYRVIQARAGNCF
jgi:hypothetical protein